MKADLAIDQPLNSDIARRKDAPAMKQRCCTAALLRCTACLVLLLVLLHGHSRCASADDNGLDTA